MVYAQAISNPQPNYFERVGLEFDIAVNVLTGGKLGQTVSLRSAIGAGYTAEGRTGPRQPGWCLMCWFLNWAVQRGHCPDQFVSGPTPPVVMIRAGLAFGTGFILLFGLLKLVAI